MKQTQKNLYIKCIYIVIYGMYGTERAGCYMHPHLPTRPYKNISENTKKNLQNQKKYISLFKSHITHSCIISYRH